METTKLSHHRGSAASTILPFRRFTPNDYGVYKRYYAHIDPVSDLSLNNLIIWLDINQDLHLAEDNGNVVLRYSCPFLGDETVFSVVGTHEPLDTILKIFAYQRAHDLPQKIMMVPQHTVTHLKLSEMKTLRIEEDKENFDYIYSVSEKANLSLPVMAKFRRTINRFIRDYGDDVTIREINLQELSEVKKLINALHIWKSMNIVSNNDKLNVEGPALNQYMQHRNLLKPQCIGVYVEDRLVGFSIFHFPPQKGYAIINHIKCDYSYKNIFDFLFFCVMNDLRMKGITYANGEQDLGIEGIRNYKHRLGPNRYIKRYTVSAKS